MMRRNNAMRLDGKVAIITASAGAGIGSVTARLFAQEGAHVVISDTHAGRTPKVAEEIAATYGRKAIGIVCDVSQRTQVDNLITRTLESFGQIDILVNNAGRNVLTPVVDMTDEQWDVVIDVCLKGTFLCSRAVLKSMIARRTGAIVSLSSIAGWRGSAQGEAHYCAAKAGIMGFTKALAQEVAPYNIRVNAVAPGLIYNDFLARIYPADFFAQAKAEVPMGRLGEPSDVAKTILFLVADESSYITGETICISGGRYMPA
jgi:3-oxoacyl-[acyl-carrier protein] reductase